MSVHSGAIFLVQPSLRPRMRRRLQKTARPPNTENCGRVGGTGGPDVELGRRWGCGRGDLGRCAGAPRADFQSVRRGGCRL